MGPHGQEMLITDGENERIDKGVTMETPMEIFKSEDDKVNLRWGLTPWTENVDN